MSKSKWLVLIVESELNNRLNVSGVPKAATIFYHGDQWLFELKPGEESDNELRRRERSVDMLSESANNIKIALGPFDFQPVEIEIELSKVGNRCLYSVTSINGRRLVQHIQGTRGPIAALKLDGGAAFDAVKIPDGTTHYCWLNALDIKETEGTKAKANEAAMLLLGGLAYFNLDTSDTDHPTQINRFVLTKNGRLEYNGPQKWCNEYTKTLSDQDRFMFSLHTSFSKAGVPHTAFINADEELVSSNDPNRKWVPSQNCAFVYLFNEDKSPNDRDCYFELSPYILGTLESNE